MNRQDSEMPSAVIIIRDYNEGGVNMFRSIIEALNDGDFIDGGTIKGKVVVILEDSFAKFRHGTNLTAKELLARIENSTEIKFDHIVDLFVTHSGCGNSLNK